MIAKVWQDNMVSNACSYWTPCTECAHACVLPLRLTVEQREEREGEKGQEKERLKMELEEKIWKEAEEGMRQEFESRMQQERQHLQQQVHHHLLHLLYSQQYNTTCAIFSTLVD